MIILTAGKRYLEPGAEGGEGDQEGGQVHVGSGEIYQHLYTYLYLHFLCIFIWSRMENEFKKIYHLEAFKV